VFQGCVGGGAETLGHASGGVGSGSGPSSGGAAGSDSFSGGAFGGPGASSSGQVWAPAATKDAMWNAAPPQYCVAADATVSLFYFSCFLVFGLLLVS